MKASTNKEEFAEAFLDTPFNPPHNPRSEEDAMRMPGCHLKSVEQEMTSSHWPRYFGTLTSYDEGNDRVVVISKTPHGVDGRKTVWTGTVAEYLAMWRCD